jgi:hypothetical protein
MSILTHRTLMGSTISHICPTRYVNLTFTITYPPICQRALLSPVAEDEAIWKMWQTILNSQWAPLPRPAHVAASALTPSLLPYLAQHARRPCTPIHLSTRAPSPSEHAPWLGPHSPPFFHRTPLFHRHRSSRKDLLLPHSPLFPTSTLLHRPATSSHAAGAASPQPQLHRSSAARRPTLNRPLRPIPSQINALLTFLLPSLRCRRSPRRRRPLEKPCTAVPSTARMAAVDGLTRWPPRSPSSQNRFAVLPSSSCWSPL